MITVSTSGFIRREGISTIILDYYSLFDKEKFDLDLVVSGDYNPDLVGSFQKIGVNICFLPSRKKDILKYILRLACLLKVNQYDAIYVHGSSAIMSIELVLAKIFGCKIRVSHSHNTTCDYKKIDHLLRPVFYHSYTRAVACGVEAGKWLYGERKFEVIKNGRDLNIYKYDPNVRKAMREALDLDDNTIAIGHVGNFNEQKNQKFLIDVMDEVRNRNENTKLYLMGDGRTREIVEQLAKEKNLNNQIIFTGSIQNVPEMLQAMDVMVLPSLYEGLPLVSVEWQIAGLPCVLSECVTKECAYTDLVRFLSLDAGPQAWAEEILKVKRFDREEVAVECIKLTKENGYSLEENVERLQSFFLK